MCPPRTTSAPPGPGGTTAALAPPSSGPATVSTHQYDKFRPLVDQIVKKQTMLCNRLVSEAEALWEQKKVEEAAKIVQELEGNFRGAGWNVLKVLWGSGWDLRCRPDLRSALGPGPTVTADTCAGARSGTAPPGMSRRESRVRPCRVDRNLGWQLGGDHNAGSCAGVRKGCTDDAYSSASARIAQS